MPKTQLRLPSSIRGTRRTASALSTTQPTANTWRQTARTAFTQLNSVISTAISTGLLVGLLWLIGRYYAVGYFSAMHIPFFQLTFSIWDYVVQGLASTWVGVVISVMLVGTFFAYTVWIGCTYADVATWPWHERLVLCLFLYSVLIGLAWWLNGDIPRLSVWITLLVFNGGIFALPSWLPTARTIAPTALTILVFVSPLIAVPIIIFGIGPMALKSGWQGAQAYMQNGTMHVRLISSEPTIMDAQPSTTLSVNGQDIYTYDGFYLLTFNEGRYFLFRNLAADCTPTQVYIVLEAQVQSVQYVPMKPLTCTPTSPVPVSPTPSPPLSAP